MDKLYRYSLLILEFLDLMVNSHSITNVTYSEDIILILRSQRTNAIQRENWTRLYF